MNLMKAGLALQGASIMTEQTDLDMAEWDRREQAAEARTMAIESRVNGLWQDKDAICRVIAENSGALDSISWLDDKPAQDAIREFIDECFTTEAKEDLNL